MSDDDKLDVDAWEPQLPPSDFAERVLGQIRLEEQGAKKPQKAPRRWRRDAAVASVLALAAALALRVTGAPDAHGEAIAKDRIEVSLGSRARAVLEPGAQV